MITIPTEQLFFIGLLTQNQPLSVGAPSEYCLEDGRLYQGTSHRLGDLNITGLANTSAAQSESNTLVFIRGSLHSDLNQILVDKGPCPDGYGATQMMMQIRSDWTSPECGFNIGHSTREVLSGLSYIAAEKVQLLDIFEAQPSSDESWRVTVQNPFDQPITAITVDWHFERGPGKPTPHHEIIPLTERLAPGDKLEVLLQAPPVEGTRYTLHDFRLRGTVATREFELGAHEVR